MNIYEKLQTVRVELQTVNLKKSGKNKFANYNYFELGDFLPTVNKLLKEFGLTSVISYFEDHAELHLFNTEKPAEYIVIQSPTARAELKGCTPIQEIGAVQTYLRRYLYLTLLEIVENDLLDAVSHSDNIKPFKEVENAIKSSSDVNKAISNKVISEAQQKRLFAISKSLGLEPNQVKDVIRNFGYEHSNEILQKDYEKIIEEMGK